ncbi:MAG: ATP-binding protein, partial [Allorhizobium sp.]
AGIEAADPSVVALVQTAADALAEARAERTARVTLEKAVADLERDIRERERDKHEAEVRSDAWHKDWIDTLSRTWFADKAGSIPAVRAILTAVGTLPSVLKERQDLLSRVAAMERDQVQFREAMESLLIECKEQTPVKDIVTAANALTQRFEAAKLADRLRDGKQAELEKLKEKRLGLEEELAIHKARRNEVTRFFEVDGLAEVEALLAQVRERDQLEKRIIEVRHQIMDALRMASFDEAATRLSEIEADQLERDSMEQERRIEDLTEQSKQLYAERSLAQQKLNAVGGDDAVARIEARRRTLLLEIEEYARRHLILRTGTLAADQALHLYRDRHRSAMMRRASDAFRLITGGNYSGLTTQPDRDREILIGVTRDGGSKLADAMSTGTQFQLYLALRLAGYEEFAAIRPPVPFVADDIMESFDNPRSEEVFRLLSEMAKVGQVIYLTHHWHLCEIAQRVVPDVTIHHLN